MKIIILILLTTSLFGEFYESIHSSASTYYEDKSYTNSKQKTSAKAYGVSADVHYQNSEYKIAYEFSKAKTVKPPLMEDLKVQKLFLKYAYSFNDMFTAHINYINVLDDNIAITDGGEVYGVGLDYKVSKMLNVNFTQYFSSYDDFELKQSDFKVDLKQKINKVRFKISSTTKYIDIKDKKPNGFTNNAQSNYLTTGVKLQAHYSSYHFGVGAYVGKRAFAIMDDGFKVQHHAMEFDRTYAIGFAKSLGKMVLKAQYVYQRAMELPLNNPNMEVDVIRFIATYKF